jgi:transcription termination factor Rho
MMADGYGLRSSDYNYLASPDDLFINVPEIDYSDLKPEIL